MMLSATSTTAAIPSHVETLDLAATKQQSLRLQLQFDHRYKSINCAAYVRGRRFHVVFACTDEQTHWSIDESSNGDCNLWIAHTAFEFDPKYAEEVRAFLAHTKAGA